MYEQQRPPGHPMPGTPPGPPPPGPYGRPPVGGPVPPAPAPRRGRTQIVVGAILLVVAILLPIGGFVGGLATLANRVSEYPRVSAQTGGTVELREAGEYTIFYEGPGATQGAVPPMRARLLDPSGVPVDVARSTGNQYYTVNERAGVAVATFTATTPGAYQVATRGAATGELAFTNEGVFGTIGLMFGGVILGVLLGLTGLVLLVIGIVLRVQRAGPGR